MKKNDILKSKDDEEKNLPSNEAKDEPSSKDVLLNADVKKNALLEMQDVVIASRDENAQKIEDEQEEKGEESVDVETEPADVVEGIAPLDGTSSDVASRPATLAEAMDRRLARKIQQDRRARLLVIAEEGLGNLVDPEEVTVDQEVFALDEEASPPEAEDVAQQGAVEFHIAEPVDAEVVANEEKDIQRKIQEGIEADRKQQERDAVEATAFEETPLICGRRKHTFWTTLIVLLLLALTASLTGVFATDSNDAPTATAPNAQCSVAWIQFGRNIDGEAVDDGSGEAFTMSADGSRLAVGAPGNDGKGIDSGHVRVYDLGVTCA